MINKKDQAILNAKKDVNKMNIETTAEGKSALRARFDYWIKKLKNEKP